MSEANAAIPLVTSQHDAYNNSLPPCGVAAILEATHPWNILRLTSYLTLPQPHKGVAIKSPTITFRGEEARFAHLIPSLWYRNPQGGSMFNNRVNAHE